MGEVFLAHDPRLDRQVAVKRIRAGGGDADRPWAAGDESLTRDGAVLGIQRVMSPEQACGDATDARSDLFSFGVLLYEMFTGRSPVTGPPAFSRPEGRTSWAKKLAVRPWQQAGVEAASVPLLQSAKGSRLQAMVHDVSPSPADEYDPSAPLRTLKLGAVEEWTVSSAAGNHPYHIHVNAFQVMTRNADGTLHPGDWKDTLLVTPTTPVVVRSRYEDFTGAFVLHCHILDHEDQGMMQGVEIVP
jgi:serine/threonine protein kinase